MGVIDHNYSVFYNILKKDGLVIPEAVIGNQAFKKNKEFLIPASAGMTKNPPAVPFAGGSPGNYFDDYHRSSACKDAISPLVEMTPRLRDSRDDYR